MIFGAVPVDDALGAISVHAVRTAGAVIKKGATISAREISLLREAGIASIVVAKLEPEDIGEDEAAAALAQVLCGDGIRAAPAATGRANLFAMQSGILQINVDAVHAINRLDEAVTLATLPAMKPVVAGEMIATVKIVPFGIARRLSEAAVAQAAADRPLRIAPYCLTRVGMISTRLPGLNETIIDKTVRVTAERLAVANAMIVHEARVPHDTSALTQAIKDALQARVEMILIFGASAIADRHDVIPAAIEAGGGSIIHFGMPVDPGNLLLLAHCGDVPVIGAPGCARSPKENGFDWILSRTLAGWPIVREDIVRMSVGGLLMEIVTRPQPRAIAPLPQVQPIAALVMAAGLSSRMGSDNKLLALLDGKPLVRVSVEKILRSKAANVVVVTGHDADQIRATLAGLDVRFIHNPDYRQGMSTSLRAGIAALNEGCAGAMICLGDMPQVDSGLIDKLIDAFDPQSGALIVAPMSEGRRGNPVLWARQFFPELLQLSGDAGARHLIERHRDALREVEADGSAAFLDVDTPEALAALRKR